MALERTKFAFPDMLEASMSEQHGSGRTMNFMWDAIVVLKMFHVTTCLSGVWKRLEKNVWIKVEV